MASKNCVICGAPSGMYPLCKKHLEMKNEGLVIKNETTGEWEEVKKNQNIITLDTEKPLTECLICKSEANGYLFCKNCYHKYKNKVLLLKIARCTEIELMDEAYEGKYTCADGHIVKSKSERAIDDYLYYKKIPHAYEKAFPIDNNADNDLHPDFYLPELDVYIEHWGFDDSNKKYKETKDYKIEQYKKAKITIISTDENKDMADINAALDRKLKTYIKGEIN